MRSGIAGEASQWRPREPGGTPEPLSDLKESIHGRAQPGEAGTGAVNAGREHAAAAERAWRKAAEPKRQGAPETRLGHQGPRASDVFSKARGPKRKRRRPKLEQT